MITVEGNDLGIMIFNQPRIHMQLRLAEKKDFIFSKDPTRILQSEYFLDRPLIYDKVGNDMSNGKIITIREFINLNRIFRVNGGFGFKVDVF